VFQASVLGGGLGFFAWCVLLCYILELNKNFTEALNAEPIAMVLVPSKRESSTSTVATQTVLGLSRLS
jgi:hypothetical protein